MCDGRHDEQDYELRTESTNAYPPTQMQPGCPLARTHDAGPPFSLCCHICLALQGDKWQTKFQRLKQFQREHGHIKVPRCSTDRVMAEAIKTSAFPALTECLFAGVLQLEQRRSINQSCSELNEWLHMRQDLHWWIKDQRSNFKKNRLTSERVDKLRWRPLALPIRGIRAFARLQARNFRFTQA